MLDGKNILITGGTGSFGKKFIEIILSRFKPSRVIVYSRDELKQHEMRMSGFDSRCMRYFIGDVRDLDRLKRAMHGVDIVIHAAALKQVPSCEYNPFEAVKTNINGAQNVVDAAIDCDVNKVVALSTDKAVNPVNLYGATKLCAEKLFVQGNSYSKPMGPFFSCVRYGNVIGSRGSVIPLFMEQKKNGKITITDAQMTRFWLTLVDAVELVLKALAHMQGGEIFVPIIPSMKITDLAEAIAPECKIDTIGIRPGEKLHEVLLTEDEGREAVEYDGMYVIFPKHSWWKKGNYKKATKLPVNFQYCSKTNKRWLTIDDLKNVVDEAFPEGNSQEISEFLSTLHNLSEFAFAHALNQEEFASLSHQRQN